MANVASYLCLLILSPLLLSFHFHITHCRRHLPSSSRKLLALPTPSLFIPPVFPAPEEPRQEPTFPSFQEPLLPPGPVANSLLPNLPFPKIPDGISVRSLFPPLLPLPPVRALFPPLPLPLPPVRALFPPLPLPPLFPGHSKSNEIKNVAHP